MSQREEEKGIFSYFFMATLTACLAWSQSVGQVSNLGELICKVFICAVLGMAWPLSLPMLLFALTFKVKL